VGTVIDWDAANHNEGTRLCFLTCTGLIFRPASELGLVPATLRLRRQNTDHDSLFRTAEEAEKVALAGGLGDEVDGIPIGRIRSVCREAGAQVEHVLSDSESCKLLRVDRAPRCVHPRMPRAEI